MLRLAAVVLAATFMLPASAHAKPPAKSVAGVKLTWPSATVFAPGAKVTVRVKSSHRRTRLALLRVNAGGKALGAVARRTLRTGTFSARLPQVAGARYQLRATIAGKRYSRPLTTASPPLAALGCPVAPASATLSLGATPALAGQTVSYGLNNTSAKACVTAGLGFGLEHQRADGTWEAVPITAPVPAVAAIVKPGQSLSKTALIPGDARYGTYRLTDSATAPDGSVIALTSAPFVVVGVIDLSCDVISTTTVPLDPAAVTRGATFSLPTPWPSVTDATVTWERRVDGSWVAYPDGTVDLATGTAGLPADAPAGVYRVHESSTGTCPGDRQVITSEIALS